MNEMDFDSSDIETINSDPELVEHLRIFPGNVIPRRATIFEEKDELREKIKAVAKPETPVLQNDLPKKPEASPWIPDAFWEARRWHKELHDWALGERLSPDAALGVSYARIGGGVPKGVRFNTGIDPISLNIYSVLFGASGAGKSLVNRKLRKSSSSTVREFNGLPSGEGLLDAYMSDLVVGKDDKGKDRTEKIQTAWDALFFIDDADGMMKAGRRPNSTLFSILEIAFFGDDLRTINADDRRKRHIKDYSLGLIIGAQPTVSSDLAREHTTGLPQRFGWYGTKHPEIGRGKRTQRSAPGVPIATLKEFETYFFEQDVMDRVDEVFCNRPGDEWWFQHYLALRCKWAVMLSITSGRHGRPVVTMDDWLLSEIMWISSCATLMSALADAEAVSELEEERKTNRTVANSIAVAEARGEVPSRDTQRVANNIVKHVADGKSKWREVTQAIKSSDRVYLPAAAALAERQGSIIRDGANVRLANTRG